MKVIKKPEVSVGRSLILYGDTVTVKKVAEKAQPPKLSKEFKIKLQIP